MLMSIVCSTEYLDVFVAVESFLLETLPEKPTLTTPQPTDPSALPSRTLLFCSEVDTSVTAVTAVFIAIVMSSIRSDGIGVSDRTGTSISTNSVFTAGGLIARASGAGCGSGGNWGW